MRIYRALTDGGAGPGYQAGAMKRNILIAILAAAFPVSAKSPAPPVDAPSDKVQIALLLDTSNSMDGLIDQAKTQLWKVVNTFNDARRDGRVPYVEVSLFEYGNNDLHVGNHWIRQIEPLTRDLDEISRELFSLRTHGGDEYCGAVIQRALADLSWDPSPHTYKVIFIAGNEPFTQGPVDARQACRDAAERGIVVNTIHCGSWDEGVAGSWHDGAALAGGKFLSINQDRAVAHIDAPQDREIAALGIGLNKTYLGYGTQWKAAAEKQAIADRDAHAHLASGAAVQRALTKASANYCNIGWDLVDAVREKSVNLSEIPEVELPAAMRAMKPAEREAHLAAMAAKRSQIQEKIRQLNLEREAHVAEKARQHADQDGNRTLDLAITETVRTQASACGYSFGE